MFSHHLMRLLALFAILLPTLSGQESFRVHLGPYFTERQNGNIVDLTIDYQYEGILERALMPDYREIQILVEELIYGEESIGIFWELVNRELVRRLLLTYPQFPEVESRFQVYPRNHLVITRSSSVRWTQSDLSDLGVNEDFRRLDYYQMDPERPGILLPRAFVDSLKDFPASWRADGNGPFWVDVSLHQLEGNAQLLDDALTMAGPGGPYDFIVLPAEAAPAGWVRGPQVSTLQSWVEITNPEAGQQNLIVEEGLAHFLGIASQVETAKLREARERFFMGDFGRTVYPAAYAASYRAMGWPIRSFGVDLPLFLFFHPEKEPSGETLDQLESGLNP